MENKLQGAAQGGGATLRSRPGGVPLEPFIHQVGGDDVGGGKADVMFQLNADDPVLSMRKKTFTSRFFPKKCADADGVLGEPYSGVSSKKQHNDL